LTQRPHAHRSSPTSRSSLGSGCPLRMSMDRHLVPHSSLCLHLASVPGSVLSLNHLHLAHSRLTWDRRMSGFGQQPCLHSSPPPTIHVALTSPSAPPSFCLPVQWDFSGCLIFVSVGTRTQDLAHTTTAVSALGQVLTSSSNDRWGN
jgi:hypothetical protein